jgi:hypothetical protein
MRLICAGVLIVLFTTPAAFAQDTTRKWLLGADHESGMYVGVAASSSFRLEGELALVRRKDSYSYSGTVEDLSTASYRFGLGFLWQWPAAARLRFYAGPRLGMNLLRSEDRLSGGTTGRATTSRTDFFLAASLGAEFFPADRLSAGADVQLRGVSQGTASRTTTGTNTTAGFLPSDPTLATRGLLVLRFYL